MEKNHIDQICKKIASEYPVFKGVKPKIGNAAGGNSLLVFEQEDKTADGLKIKNILRVIVSSEGKILQISSSR